MLFSKVAAVSAGAIAIALSVATWAPSAHAQETCNEDAGGPPQDFGQLIETFPSNNAREIPRDGFVRFVYRGRVPPRPVMIVRDNDNMGATVEGTLTVVGAELHWHARASLRARAQYSVTASDIIGGTSEVRFTTAATLAGDTAPSGFDGALSATSERSGATDICGDENARSVTVGWKFARSSPWPPTELTYVVFETRGPGINGPIERARDRGRLTTTPCAANADQCLSFRLSSANASGPACFSVQVFDPLGRGVSNSVEKCINLDAGNYFYGCSVRPTEPIAGADRDRSRSAQWLTASTAALGFVLVVSARARRRARRG